MVSQFLHTYFHYRIKYQISCLLEKNCAKTYTKSMYKTMRHQSSSYFNLDIFNFLYLNLLSLPT